MKKLLHQFLSEITPIASLDPHVSCLNIQAQLPLNIALWGWFSVQTNVNIEM